MTSQIGTDAADLRQAIADIGDARALVQGIVERGSFPHIKRIIRPDITLRDSADSLSVLLREAEGILARSVKAN